MRPHPVVLYIYNPFYFLPIFHIHSLGCITPGSSKLLQNNCLNTYYTTGLLQSFQTPKMCHLWLISSCEKKIALHIKSLMISYPHFLKMSFNLTKCGLSYGFKHDLRPFSECLYHFILDSLQNPFLRLSK